MKGLPDRDLDGLLRELDSLRQENSDLHWILLSTSEHGDLIEAQLAEANLRLREEIDERRQVESTLRLVLETVSQQKQDLESLVQILSEHGDLVDSLWRDEVAEVKTLLNLDPLTRLHNRRGLDEFVGQQWQDLFASREPLALVAIDIDHFKLYNDHYGHLAGDECLIQVAKTLCESVTGITSLVARQGGEEFAVVLPMLEREAAITVAERLRVAVAALGIPHCRSETAAHVTISAGVASFPPTPAANSELLFREADRLLYLAKQSGRNRVAG